MRTHAALATVSVAVLVGSSHAVDPVTLSLRWLDKQAYVANVTIDGQPTLLQVGTFNMDTWVACSRFGNRSCDASRSIGTIAVENGVADVAFLYSKTLGIQDADGSKTVEFSNSASMYRAEYNASMASKLPLVGNDTQGVLGLGPYNGLACSGVNGSCSNMSLYLSSNSDGAGSFVKIGGDTSSGFSSSSGGSTTRYSMAVRDTDVQGWTNKRWYLSLVGVRFGDSKPMYPRVYSSVETPGADAKALVSLNHATLQMPPALHSKLMTSYLSACQGFKTSSMGWYYECDASVMNSLPRLSLYVADKVFYLDPTDYTQASSTDTTKVVVLVASSGIDDSWVFGAPFLRKFPSIFSPDANSIDLFCTVGSSCRVESGVLDREAVDSTAGSQDNGGSNSRGSSSPGIGSRTTYGPATSAPPSYGYAAVHDSSLWIMWIAKCMGFLMVFILVARAVRRCRGKRQAADRELAMQQTGRNGDTGTVASERDLEEAKEALARMLAEEEATAAAMATSRNDADFVALQSPGAESLPRSPSIARRS